MNTYRHQQAVFISDLHLSEARPDCSRAFYSFLENLTQATDALFILGDFFDYWVGDDIQTPLSETVAKKLTELKQRIGLTIYFAPGNRDFSIGHDYCKLSSMVLLNDETLIEIADRRVLVTHGDQYCLEDVSYLRYRRIIRHPIVFWLLKKTPKSFRSRLGKKIRRQSTGKFERQAIYVDVDGSEIERRLEHFNADCMIHGHTHRADIHYHESTNSNPSRVVLGDWFHVGWLAVLNGNNEPKLCRFDIKNPEFTDKFI